MYNVARISYGVQALARVPRFGHQLELRELGITINSLSVHGHVASTPAVISEAQEEDWRSRSISPKLQKRFLIKMSSEDMSASHGVIGLASVDSHYHPQQYNVVLELSLTRA